MDIFVQTVKGVNKYGVMEELQLISNVLSNSILKDQSMVTVELKHQDILSSVNQRMSDVAYYNVKKEANNLQSMVLILNIQEQ
ncbi:hypothetical protein TSAR_010215 [Trichomalopsis sarcophagae]|uniref:Uncharacterized protein n=1 Tax=Trichomalopsis sarcophagae TaxID=543379 RepID=A0A232FNI7_9HYME|nr:hypothetical protein TSAR_010215 [Trichomalopsis sarcophagae]